MSGPVPREVLAFYYGWYGNPQVSGQWVHWQLNEAGRITNVKDTPSRGAYDSHDGAVVHEQVRAAKAAGITGFVVSWWGQGNFTDQGLPLMLREAAAAGLKVTVYVEVFPQGTDPATLAAQAGELDYLIKTYATAPAWLKVGGRPVIFVYSAVLGVGGAQWRLAMDRARADTGTDPIFVADVAQGLGAEAIQRAAAYSSVFDGIHGYGVRGMRGQYSIPQDAEIARRNYAQWALGVTPGQIFCATVMAGYDDSMTGRPPPRPVAPRQDGAVYSALWQAALAVNPDWILIDSWSEWHEGTEIEPSREYGTRYLDLTRSFARRFTELAAKRH